MRDLVYYHGYAIPSCFPSPCSAKPNKAGWLPCVLPKQALPHNCTTQMTAGTGRNDDSSSKWKLVSLEGFLWQAPVPAFKLLVVLGGKCWLQVPLGVFLRGKQVTEMIFKENVCLCCKPKALKVLGAYKRAACDGEGGGSACRAVLTEPPVPEMGGRPAGFILPCSALGLFAEVWGMFKGEKLLLRGN